MGLGLLGRGVGDAAFLAENGAEVTVTDIKTKAQLAESASQLEKYPNIRFVLGEHKTGDFENVDMVFVAAGVPLDSPYLAHARDKGVKLVMSAAFFAEKSGIPVIGVTGTRGKSTVVHFITHTLAQAGVQSLLGGNIRGVSNLQLLKVVEGIEIAVMELDSWQLQGFGWAGISPHIAVFTNLFEDHLNYYPDMETYFRDKANIYVHQKEDDALIIGKTVAEVWMQKLPALSGVKVPQILPSDWILQIPGEHNRENAALAVEAMRAYGLSEAVIKAGIESFTGVEGRLQLVKEVGGSKIYNDNNATTPLATMVALEALDTGKKNVILIAGGADKGLDISELTLSVAKHCRQVILTPGSGTDRLVSLLHDGTVGVSVVEDLRGAVEAAQSAASEGDILLFSPAFASFAQFKNEYERNDEFVRIVNEL